MGLVNSAQDPLVGLCPVFTCFSIIKKKRRKMQMQCTRNAIQSLPKFVNGWQILVIVFSIYEGQKIVNQVVHEQDEACWLENESNLNN